MKKITLFVLVFWGCIMNSSAQTLQQCTTDNNNDGVTNTSDFLNLVGQFGQNCAPLGTISSFTCLDITNNGTLFQGNEAIDVSSIISYIGGNGGDYNGQLVNSTGVEGLYALLVEGSFASGAGSLTYRIFGTPTSSGTASFALNIGGQNCTLTRAVALPVGSITALSCSTATNNGTLTQGVAAASVNSSVPYTGGNGGTHSGQTVTSTGVTGLTATLIAGNFANGSGSLTYTITGTPATSGTATFELSIGGQNCSLTRAVALPVGSITALSCSTATNNGTLTQGVAAASVSSSVPYTGGNGGTHSGQTITSTGVTGLTATLAADTFANGSGSLTYTITGTPATSGTASFAINIGGQNCTLTRAVALPVGSITALSCSTATNNGTLTQGVAAASISSSVPYTGGNGGTHSGQTITSTGVTGLTATLTAGNFANGSGSLTYTITGTPATSGTASFALSIGGQNCTLTRAVNLPVGTITALSCSTATNTGTLTQGVSATSVSSSVPYTGGNGGTYGGQTVTSTGVTGLTATLIGGTFLSGSGSLTYTITGTPSSSGVASFALNIGGRTCALARTVVASIGSITTLNCSSATNSGILTQGVAAISVSSSIPYNGGNGGSYSGQTVTSTGVTGLIATLIAGNFANGSGNLIYTITGTPGSIGTASFAINIGGQFCTLTRTVGQTGITQHSCGATNVHNPAKTYGTITDQQGNVYKTIVIGTQEWMAENLRTSIYVNGETIANVTDATLWNNRTTGAWCYYDNNSAFDCPYGKLYNWYAVSDARKVCPTGWHLPTQSDWLALSVFIGGFQGGGAIKSVGTQYWSSPNSNATNTFGFSGIPGGTRYNTFGWFGSIGFGGSWWTSGDVNQWNANRQFLRYDNGDFGNVDTPKQTGLSVRCLKD